MKMNRSLNEIFINDINSGILKELLIWIKRDSTLDLQFRGNYIDIYYRGGRILNLKQLSDSTYNASIDKNYLKIDMNLPSNISKSEDLKIWLDNFPNIKKERDFHYSEEKNTAEREFVQLIIRSNNYERTSKSTDFYITDMEYNDIGKIDLIGLQLLQNLVDKLIVRFAFIEVKFGNGAVKGQSGLKKHLEDINKFVALNNYQNINDLKLDTQKILQQKILLGITPFDENYATKKIVFEDGKPLFVVLLADYKQKSKNLDNLIKEIDENDYPEINIKFSLGSFMGYGIYSDCLYSKNQILTYLRGLNDN